MQIFSFLFSFDQSLILLIWYILLIWWQFSDFVLMLAMMLEFIIHVRLFVFFCLFVCYSLILTVYQGYFSILEVVFMVNIRLSCQYIGIVCLVVWFIFNLYHDILILLACFVCSLSYLLLLCCFCKLRYLMYYVLNGTK